MFPDFSDVLTLLTLLLFPASSFYAFYALLRLYALTRFYALFTENGSLLGNFRNRKALWQEKEKETLVRRRQEVRNGEKQSQKYPPATLRGLLTAESE